MRNWNPFLTRARLAALLAVSLLSAPAFAASSHWTVGTPIVSYWCGPALTDAVAEQMAQGGWNLVWCDEAGLDIAHRHGLRGQIQDGLLSPATLDDPARKQQLDALIGRVSKHPAFYAYFITDEPSAAQFPALGRLVAYIKEKDPAHLAYINLFPTYATNEQLGNKGDKVTAYTEHLRQFVDQVKPALVSYDHYQFSLSGDNPEYFLNLSLVRRESLAARLPFLNIVQASTWAPKVMRVPGPEEMRYLVYTTVAYGAQGISYYIYTCANHLGGVAEADGTPTPLYHALKTLNREFTAIASQLQPLQSLAVYHAGMMPPGAEPLPKEAPITLDPLPASAEYQGRERVKGALLGYFGPAGGQVTHAVLVNLDYKHEASFNLRAPGPVELFDAAGSAWSPAGGPRATVKLAGGAGQLIRIK